MRRGRRKKLKPGSSLVQAPAKRNMRAPVAEAAAGRAGGRLFDRHGEPGDQPRDLVQMLGIMLFNGLREPKQAFVVTHGGNVAWNDRRYRAVSGRSAGWHQIRSHETRHDRAFWPIESNWRPGSITPVYDEIAPAMGSSGRWPGGRNRRTNRCNAGRFPAPLHASAQPVIWSFASPKGFVIRCPLANLCFACSSVAQR